MKENAPTTVISDSHPKPSVVALYSDIGRGHPSYLDSLLYLLKDEHPSLVVRTVFDESKGLFLLSWKFVSWLYGISGKGGLQTRFYNFIRRRSQKGSHDSLATKLLGRDLKKAYAGFEGICLVDHPLIARSLAGVCRVWYVHGEIAAPAECAIKGVEKILVPLEETKEKLVAQGAEAEAVVTCGLMIEPQLVQDAKVVFKKRLERIKSNQPLMVGFFTSGAYPKEHMEKIMLGAESIIRAKYKAIVFCGTNPHKFDWVKNRAKGWGVKIVEDREAESPESDDFDLMLVSRKTRQEDTQRAVELIPQLDAFAAASHERTNWAVGLGLPMFVLFPLIGTFASQNFEFAQKQGVVYPVESIGKAENLGQLLTELRQGGRLPQMAEDGFGTLTIDGMDAAVSCLTREIDLIT
jgi:hypothetical protein